MAADTGSFVTTGQTGHVHVNYVSTGSTGNFVTTNLTGNFASITGGYLLSSQIPNVTGDVCINAGSNNSTVYKIQGYPIANTAPATGQMLQFNGTSWVPGAIAAGGNGGGGLVYYFNDTIAADLPTGSLPTSLSGTFELGRSGMLTQKSITSPSLSQVNYDPIVGFITDVLDPDVTSIPAGLFDFNIWASSSSTSQTVLQLKVYKYDGATTTPTLLATSDDVYTYDGTVIAQYIMSIVLPQTSITTTDRLFVLLSAKALGNNKTITLYFGGNTPSHVHTTFPSVGGSGLVKVINGIMQNPASTIVDVDISDSAAIAGYKIQSGYFALASATGAFVSTGMTGALTGITGGLVGTGMTGALTGMTGELVSTGMTGVLTGLTGGLGFSGGNVLNAICFTNTGLSISGISYVSSNLYGAGFTLSSSDEGQYLGKVKASEHNFCILESTIGYEGTYISGAGCAVTSKLSADGKYSIVGVQNGYLFRSCDYSKNFINTNVSGCWTCVGMSADGKVNYVTNYSGHIYASYDCGINWYQKPAGSVKKWVTISTSADGKFVTAAGDCSCIWVSCNYGICWTSTQTSGACNWSSNSMSADGRVQTAVAYNAGTSSSCIWVSNDYGNNWSPKAGSSGYYKVDVSNDGRIQSVASYGNSIFMSYDFGCTWACKTPSTNHISISMACNGKVIAVGTNVYLCVSTNYGCTWASRSISKNWYSVSFSNDARYLQSIGGTIPTTCLYMSTGLSYISNNICTSGTSYANNFCASNGLFYGNGSGLTGLLTGCFVTTAQTGGLVGTGMTGALTGLTGGLVGTGMTGALTGLTGGLVGTGSTGVFALAAGTGSFLTSTSLDLTSYTAPSGSARGPASCYNSILNGTGHYTNQSHYSTILNGVCNQLNLTCYSIILGGSGHYTNGSVHTNNLIGVGFNNSIYSSYFSTVLNGCSNTVNAASKSFATILNGCQNQANADYSTVINGAFNCVTNCFSTIINSCSGVNNGTHSTIIGPNNTITNGNSVNIIGSGIVLAGGQSTDNTTYFNNVCSYNGAFFGNGSGLTSLATGAFVDTGMTGTFVDTGMTGALTGMIVTSTNFACGYCTNKCNLLSSTSNSKMLQGTSYNVIFATYMSCITGTSCQNAIIAAANSRIQNGNSYTAVIGSAGSAICCSSTASIILGSCGGVIYSGGKWNGIIGGCGNFINSGASGSVILAGDSITAIDPFTTYSNNFCACDGKYYGNGSGLTGIQKNNIVGAGSSYEIFEHFMSTFASSNGGIFYAVCNLGGLTSVPNANDYKLGVLTLKTCNSPTINSSAGINTSSSSVSFTGANTEYCFATSLTRTSSSWVTGAGTSGVARWGYSNCIQNTGVEMPTYGAFFRSCNSSTASIQFFTRNDTVCSGTSIASPTMTSGVYNTFEIYFPSDCSYVMAKINGTQVACHTGASIPTGRMGVNAFVNRHSADANDVNLTLDYIYFKATPVTGYF